mmetsp:Transcript_7000/g.20980  ORF Transcript_7000/g.20980 Transcript_7000/m.20980 type:complete len:84 (+) Transcript_7000:216-467(+)
MIGMIYSRIARRCQYPETIEEASSTYTRQKKIKESWPTARDLKVSDVSRRERRTGTGTKPRKCSRSPQGPYDDGKHKDFMASQ